LAKIADELAKEKSAFSMEDRIGTVYDVWALAKSGHTPASSALNLVNTLHEEPECIQPSLIIIAVQQLII
jgi:aminopeptidase 2